VGRPRQRFQSACGDAPSDAFLAACRKRSPRLASILDGLRSIRKQSTLSDYAQLIEVPSATRDRTKQSCHRWGEYSDRRRLLFVLRLRYELRFIRSGGPP